MGISRVDGAPEMPLPESKRMSKLPSTTLGLVGAQVRGENDVSCNITHPLIDHCVGWDELTNGMQIGWNRSSLGVIAQSAFELLICLASLANLSRSKYNT
jgi:hypothetical protein